MATDKTKRIVGQAEYASNFEVKKQAPLDARTVIIGTKADLILPETWSDADGNVWLYDGMPVSVRNNGGTPELYVLKNKEKYTSADSWIRVDGGAGSGTIAIPVAATGTPTASFASGALTLKNLGVFDIPGVGNYEPAEQTLTLKVGVNVIGIKRTGGLAISNGSASVGDGFYPILTVVGTGSLVVTSATVLWTSIPNLQCTGLNGNVPVLSIVREKSVAKGHLADDVTVNGKKLNSAPTLTGADIAVSGSDTRKVDAALDALGQRISALGTVLNWQGTKATLAEIKAITSAKKGDVWHCTADGGEYACTKDITAADASAWEPLGKEIDLSGYATKAQAVSGVATAHSSEVGTTTLNLEVSFADADKVKTVVPIPVATETGDGVMSAEQAKTLADTKTKAAANETAISGLKATVDGLPAAADIVTTVSFVTETI